MPFQPRKQSSGSAVCVTSDRSRTVPSHVPFVHGAQQLRPTLPLGFVHTFWVAGNVAWPVSGGTRDPFCLGVDADGKSVNKTLGIRMREVVMGGHWGREAVAATLFWSARRCGWVRRRVLVIVVGDRFSTSGEAAGKRCGVDVLARDLVAHLTGLPCVADTFVQVWRRQSRFSHDFDTGEVLTVAVVVVVVDVVVVVAMVVVHVAGSMFLVLVDPGFARLMVILAALLLQHTFSGCQIDRENVRRANSRTLPDSTVKRSPCWVPIKFLQKTSLDLP